MCSRLPPSLHGLLKDKSQISSPDESMTLTMIVLGGEPVTIVWLSGVPISVQCYGHELLKLWRFDAYMICVPTLPRSRVAWLDQGVMLVRRFRNNSCFQIIGPVAFAVLAPRYPCEELACSYHQITPFKTMKGVNRTSKNQMLGGVGTPLTFNF